MNESDIRALIRANPMMSDGPESGRRELLKQQAAELMAREREHNARLFSPAIAPEIEQAYISAQVLLHELRKRKRDEGF